VTPVSTTLVLHIAAGGFVALYSAKGGRLHRRSGVVFVYAMLAMCAAGAVLALRNPAWAKVNVAAALMTAYLVVTSLTAVRPAGPRWRPAHAALLSVAAAVALTELALGARAVAAGGRLDGVPAFPFFLFGVVGLLASVGDVRMLRSGPLTGAPRLARHLWRMSFALFVASMSFFIGQAKVIPKPVRIMPLLALPMLAVLATMLYWMWRVRWKRSLRGVVLAPRAALRSD
jgi:hypothetical protein